jgi:hypothetical protein
MGRQVQHRESSQWLFEPSSSNKVLHEELSWFFNEAESAASLPSNFTTPRGKASSWYGTMMKADLGAEERVEAACAAGTIERRLRAMPDSDVGVLFAAFGPHLWPEKLERALGPLTGIVVRLAAAGGTPTGAGGHAARRDHDVARALERSLHHEGLLGLGLLRAEAHTLLARALRAYARIRGLGPSIVPGKEE